MAQYVLVLDVGTTTIKAIVFNEDLKLISKATALPTKTKLPGGGVEQSPLELATLARNVIREAVTRSGCRPQNIVACGITNQRETVVAWDTRTGLPCHPALVWEDRRTQAYCNELKRHEPEIRNQTGLAIDPYFSASKMHWLFKHPSASDAFLHRALNIGTIDSWIVWNLSREKTYATDYTNASRTLLFSAHTLNWDASLLSLFTLPAEILAKPLPSRSTFGHLDSSIIGVSVPIMAICGDQQASHYAAGDVIGTTKATFGTGIFVSQTIGASFAVYPNLFTTLLPHRQQPWYGVEVAIPDAGAQMQAVLNNPQKKSLLVHHFAQRVAHTLQMLPLQPEVLIIDGGITQAEELSPALHRATGLTIRTQPIADGTALGVAKLLLGK